MEVDENLERKIFNGKTLAELGEDEITDASGVLLKLLKKEEDTELRKKYCAILDRTYRMDGTLDEATRRALNPDYQ